MGLFSWWRTIRQGLEVAGCVFDDCSHPPGETMVTLKDGNCWSQCNICGDIIQETAL